MITNEEKVTFKENDKKGQSEQNTIYQGNSWKLTSRKWAS